VDPLLKVGAASSEQQRQQWSRAFEFV